MMSGPSALTRYVATRTWDDVPGWYAVGPTAL